MKVQKINNVNFTRKPSNVEMQVYSNSIEKGLNLLNKQVDIIIHNSSAPSIQSENVGIGSLFSTTTIKKLFPFLKTHGIKGIQQEPNGLRKLGDNSPYAPEASSKNIFMIPLEKLTTEEYNKILSKETFDSIVKNNPDKQNVNYDYVKTSYQKALQEAFENYKKGDISELENFKKEFSSKYEPAAIFRVLSEENTDKDWSKWRGIDKNLYAPKNELEAKKAETRIEQIKKDNKDKIDFYYFQQMILEKENKKSNEISKKYGIKIIGDSPVAQPTVDEWINQNLFLENAAIGCPPDYFAKNGQRWGFKYFKPEEIFNKDGSLGRAGEFLRKKYEDYFASCPGGVRIDHIIGLIDPFIYSTNSKKMLPSNSGRIFSTFLGQYQKHTDDEYASILTKIIIPAAEKYGLDKSSIICEDLGDKNIPTEKVMKKLDLMGIFVTQFDHRGANAPENKVIMLGSHDNQSFLEFTEDLFKNPKDKRFLNKTKLLAEDTIAKNATKAEESAYLKELRTNKKQFIAASFAELFTSPARRVQIFFADFFGLGKTYNRPGTTEGNWALRIGEDFENDYYKAVAEGKAPNLADTIARALRQRGLDKSNQALMKDLENSAKILSEKI